MSHSSRSCTCTTPTSSSTSSVPPSLLPPCSSAKLLEDPILREGSGPLPPPFEDPLSLQWESQDMGPKDRRGVAVLVHELTLLLLQVMLLGVLVEDFLDLGLDLDLLSKGVLGRTHRIMMRTNFLSISSHQIQRRIRRMLLFQLRRPRGIILLPLPVIRRTLRPPRNLPHHHLHLLLTSALPQVLKPPQHLSLLPYRAAEGSLPLLRRVLP
jgi:hypothetical protein